MDMTTVAGTEDNYDQLGFSSADMTPRFGPAALAVLGGGSLFEDLDFDDATVSAGRADDEGALEVASDGQGIDVRHVARVSDVGQEDWNNLFPGLSEDWAYYVACEASKPEGFELSAVVAYQDGRLIGAVPMFQVFYRLDMSSPSALRGLGDFLAKHVPRLVKVPVLGLGSPMSEECALGFAPEISVDGRKVVLRALLGGMLEFAGQSGTKLTALKDVRDEDRHWAGDVLEEYGFARMTSLPIATVQLPFDDISRYIASLSSNMRKDLKRKINKAKAVDVETSTDIDVVHDEIIALYNETRASRHSSYESFDEVPASYFRNVMEHLDGRAKVMLFRVSGELIGFNLFLEEEGRVIGKFVGMNYALSRKYNIYFVNWLEMVRYCLERGIGEMQVGQTTYGLKIKLGGQLKRSWIYFRHDGLVLGPLFRLLGAQFGLDQADPDLKVLGDKARYLDEANSQVRN